MYNLNKNQKYIFLFLILFPTILYSTHSNKTFLNPRPILYNMPMELTTWHTQINKKFDSKKTEKSISQNHKLNDKYNELNFYDLKTYTKINRWAGSIEVTPFYQESLNKNNIGKYFGIKAINEHKIRNYISVYGSDMNQDLDGIKAGYIIHNHDEYTTFNFGGKIKFEPEQQTWGARFDYHQKLGDFFLRLNLPLANIKNKFNADKLTKLVPLDYQADYPLSGKTLADYLDGKIQMIDDEIFSGDSQYALKFAKINNHKNNHSKTGIADIDFSFGYNFLHKHGNHLGLYAATTIPTGNKADEHYLFQPILGNGKFWNIGLGIDSKFNLYNTQNNAIELLFNFDIRYIFDNTQKRTLGVRKDNEDILNFGQYYLAGKKGEFPLYPLANFLTKDIKVKPNAQLEGLLGLAFKLNNFTIDLGYDLFRKDKENVKLKSDWLDDTYAIANLGYLTAAGDLGINGPFDPEKPEHYALPEDTGITGAINSENLDIDAVKTPSQLTNKIYAGLGYAFNEWKYPLMLGIGSDYEFANNNAALEQWAIWLKLGLSF